jgi:hypothetical protein
MKIGDKVIILKAHINSHTDLHPESNKFAGCKGTIIEKINRHNYKYEVRFANHAIINWTVDRFDNGEVTWWFTDEDLKLQQNQLVFNFME